MEVQQRIINYHARVENIQIFDKDVKALIKNRSNFAQEEEFNLEMLKVNE